MSDHNRKTLRSFYCRDYLWDLFEVMTRDLGCSMDYLVNEAMRHYARSRNYSFSQGAGGQMGGAPAGGGPQMGYGQPQPPMYGQQQPPAAPAGPPAAPGGRPPQAPGMGGYGGRGMDHPTFQRMPAVQGNRPPAPPSNPYAQPSPPHMGRAPQQGGYPQPPGNRAAPPPPPARPPGMGGYGGNPAPPPPPARPPAAPGPQVRQRLSLIFNNQRHIVDKDKFIIGRGSTMTDLTIRDGNISRKHAAVIYRNGDYYIKDLDSTNGIDYKGERIDSKKVEEGDIFHICDYELRFTYQ